MSKMTVEFTILYKLKLAGAGSVHKPKLGRHLYSGQEHHPPSTTNTHYQPRRKKVSGVGWMVFCLKVRHT